MRLIESDRRSERAPAQTAASIAVHTLLIAAFVYATTQESGSILPPSSVESITFVAPRAPKAAPAPPAAPRPKPRPTPAPSTTPSTLPAPAPEPTAAPAYDASAPGTGTATGERDAYYDYEVGTAAGMLGGIRPRYPESLRMSGVEGRVEIEFVVDERGRVDMRTVKVIESTHALFLTAVRNALGGMRFTPARVNNQAVRQYVRLPVIFKLDR